MVTARPSSRPGASVAWLSRWSWFAAAAAAVPAGFAMGAARGAQLEPVARRLAPPAATGDEALAMGASVLAALVVLAGILLVVPLWALRRRHSRQVVRRSTASGQLQPDDLPAALLAAALWLTTAVAVALAVAVAQIGQPSADPELVASLSSGAGLTVGALTWAGSLATGVWAHRRARQVEPLEAVGVVRVEREADAEGPIPPIWTVLRVWAAGLVIEAVLGLGTYASGGSDANAGDYVSEWAYGVTVYPAVFAMLLLAALLVPARTRAAGLRVLADRRTRLSLLSVAIGVGLFFVVEPVGTVWLWVTAAVMAATALQLTSRGPQPWLGVALLLSYWYFGMTSDGDRAPAGEFALPSGLVGWGAVLVGTALTVREVVEHVRAHLGRVRSGVATP